VCHLARKKKFIIIIVVIFLNILKFRVTAFEDLPGTVTTAQFFAVVACLTISANLLVMYLVIFVLPTLHAVRAWWSVRILSCVALAAVLLTNVIYADCPNCGRGIGSIWNGFNVLILIGLIVLTFWIEVPEQPLLTGCCGSGSIGVGGAPTSTGDTPPAPPTNTTSGPTFAQQQQSNMFVTSSPSWSSPPPPPPPIVTCTRTEMVTPQGHKMIREVRMYPDGRQEVTETTIEDESEALVDEEEDEEEEKVIVVEEHQQQQPPLLHGQTVCVTEEMRTVDGNRKTVATTQHTDGRHEVIETVEEPSMMSDTTSPQQQQQPQQQQPPHYGDYYYPRRDEHDEEEGFTASMVVTEVRRTRAEMRMPRGNIKVIEEVEYSDGTLEVLESFVEPSRIGTGGGRTGGWNGPSMDPPEN
jgi:hypothetical protein